MTALTQDASLRFRLLARITTEPKVWPKNDLFRRYFRHPINRDSRRSAIRC